jgi:hypothetical protein
VARELEFESDTDAEDQADRPKAKKPRSSLPLGPIVGIIAIGCLGWAIFEHQQVAALKAAATQANAQVATITKEVAAKDQLIDSLNKQLNEMRLRTMPVAIVMRRASANSGLTAHFKNNAPVAMTIAVALSNPATGRRREVNIIIPPNEIRSIGEPEGWVFAPGHVIQLTQEQFGTVEYTVPVEN